MEYRSFLIIFFTISSNNDYCNNEITGPSFIPVKVSPKIKLNNGIEMPIVGFGTWQILYDKGNLKSKLLNKDQKAREVLEKAIRTGYRHIDSAWYYNIEKAFGRVLQKVISTGLIRREDFFITTKVWNTFHRRDRVIESLKMSLDDMGIDYVDLALLHYPMGYADGEKVIPTFRNGSVIPRTWKKDAYIETWQGMEEAVTQGLARSIGVSNFNSEQISKLMEAVKIKPVINQVECNPYYNQKILLDVCKQHNIQLMAYMPLRQSKELLGDITLKLFAQKYHKSIAQIALRWNIQRNVSVIPKTIQRDRMAENLNIFDFQLTSDEMNIIDEIQQKPKLLTLKYAENHPDYPFSKVEVQTLSAEKLEEEYRAK